MRTARVTAPFLFCRPVPTRIDRKPKANAPLRLMPDDYARLAARCAPKGRSRSMRSVICALALLTLATSAFAGDFDILRGSQPTTHWGGVYGGIQGGYSSSAMDFSGGVGPLVADILRSSNLSNDVSDWAVLGTISTA